MASMGIGPITIFDKSALQALSADEAVWFDAFFLANMVPVFYVETLADLEKEMEAGRTAGDLVGMLAEKTPSGAYPNVHHRDLIAAEFLGQEIVMAGRVQVAGADTVRADDGMVGFHFDGFPEQEALERWRNHEFFEVERDFARTWRDELARHNPDLLIGVLKNILPTTYKVSSLEELKAFVDDFCAGDAREVVALALGVVGVSEEWQEKLLARWETLGSPPLNVFAPYTTHVFKVDLVYYLGMHRGFISGERASNQVDMTYLYYLPFAMVFVSGDKLHRRTAPLFLGDEQSYVETEELKAALRQMDEHYEQLPDEVKERGVFSFAHWPPAEMHNTVTELWDKHMRPDWRDIAREKEAALDEPRDLERDRATIDEIKQRMESAQPAPDAAAGDGDYFVVRRSVPVRKGKWRMVPEEAEESDDWR